MRNKPYPRYNHKTGHCDKDCPYLSITVFNNDNHIPMGQCMRYSQPGGIGLAHHNGYIRIIECDEEFPATRSGINRYPIWGIKSQRIRMPTFKLSDNPVNWYNAK